MADLVEYALVSVSDVKESLGIDASNTASNNKIIRQINRATDMIENFTGRRFKLTSYTNIEYDATNTDQLVLQQRPVTTVSIFQNRDSSLNEDDWEEIETNLYFIDKAAGVLDLNFNAGGRWNRYKISYTAGYSIIPADLAEAAATLAAFFVDNPTGGTNVRRKQEGQREIEYFDSATTGSADTSLFRQLGIYNTLVAYSNLPVNPDK